MRKFYLDFYEVGVIAQIIDFDNNITFLINKLQENPSLLCHVFEEVSERESDTTITYWGDEYFVRYY